MVAQENFERKQGRTYSATNVVSRAVTSPRSCTKTSYPLRTAKCPRSLQRSALAGTRYAPENPSRRSLNHTLFVSRRPRGTQSAQEKGVHRARNPPLPVPGVTQAPANPVGRPVIAALPRPSRPSQIGGHIGQSLLIRPELWDY